MGCVYAHTLIKSLSNKKAEVSQLPQEPTICDLTKQPDSEQQGDCHVQSFHGRTTANENLRADPPKTTTLVTYCGPAHPVKGSSSSYRWRVHRPLQWDGLSEYDIMFCVYNLLAVLACSPFLGQDNKFRAFLPTVFWQWYPSWRELGDKFHPCCAHSTSQFWGLPNK